MYYIIINDEYEPYFVKENYEIKNFVLYDDAVNYMIEKYPSKKEWVVIRL